MLLQVLHLLRLLVGVALVLVATFDFVKTAVTVGGRAGPITYRLADGVHRFLLRRDLRRRRWIGVFVGPVMLSTIYLTWLLAISLGWALIFASQGVLRRAEDAVIGVLDPLEFVLATLLGQSSAISIDPGQPLWTALEITLGLMGVGFLTLSLAWVLPVVSGVASRREVAARMAAMGTTAEDVLLRAWDGEGFGNLDLDLHTLTSELAALGQRHLAYPAIHYFHSGDWRTSLGTRLATVDDAVSLLVVMGRHPGVPRSTLVSVRLAITDYVDAIGEAFLRRPADPPPPPSVERLRAAGLIDLDDAELAERFARIGDRRARLHAYVLHDGWTWEEAMAAAGERRHGIGLQVLETGAAAADGPRLDG